MQEFMDRALKERVIGAIVLVVFAVLVVPVFLDGPPAQLGEVSESIRLPGQNGTAMKTQRIVLSRNRTQPVPTPPAPSDDATPPTQTQQAPAAADAPGSVASVDATTPEKSAPSSASDTPATEQPQSLPNATDATASAQPQSATGMWAVQLGSFSNKQNAERLAADLRKNGYAAFLSQLKSGDNSLHRVRVGPQENRDNAEAVAGRLAVAGHKGQVVPHP